MAHGANKSSKVDFKTKFHEVHQTLEKVIDVSGNWKGVDQQELDDIKQGLKDHIDRILNENSLPQISKHVLKSEAKKDLKNKDLDRLKTKFTIGDLRSYCPQNALLHDKIINVSDIVQESLQNKLITVVGSAGMGKTSLLRYE